MDQTRNVSTDADDESEIRSRYAQAGQEHVFQHCAQLSPTERTSFLHQLRDIQVENVAILLKSAESIDQGEPTDETAIAPFPTNIVGRSTDEALVRDSYTTGMEAIRKNQVATLVLAGGQGTRLGFDGPKGMYSIGLPSERTLFAMMALRIRKLAALAGEENVALPFYVMTSPLNHDATVAYFHSKEYFGLPESDVFFFQQGTLPCLTKDGKIILERAGKVAVAPDGNGGIYPALQHSGALKDMTTRGVRYLHVFSIDNALIKPADPVFLGYCIGQGADCGNKVVWKSHAHEKVGVVASRGGKPCIVEYSEITTEMAESTDDDGRLLFGAGNICNHFYTLDFLREKILPNMGNMYHIAHKKIPFYDAATQSTVAPTGNNGIKLETFIFDVFPLSVSMAVFEIERSEEFSPVKNKAGSEADSPDTARAMASDQAKKWIKNAGGNLIGKVDDGVCEISPLTSYGGEGLEHYEGQDVACPFSL
jgi:UDP-N-acetylglucosamine/UDP-N-acetylgalactosamine diphosphorylase